MENRNDFSEANADAQAIGELDAAALSLAQDHFSAPYSEWLAHGGRPATTFYAAEAATADLLGYALVRRR